MLPKVKTKNTFPHLSNLDKPARTANVLHSWVGLLYVLVINYEVPFSLLLPKTNHLFSKDYFRRKLFFTYLVAPH